MTLQSVFGWHALRARGRRLQAGAIFIVILFLILRRITLTEAPQPF